MRKKLLYTSLWGILTLSLLSSCRTEDGAITQKQVENKRFAVFTPSNGKTVNYANGFAFLMQQYDNLHKTNLTGVVNNNPVIGNLNASINKNTSVIKTLGSYIEFRIHSQTITGENGDKWVVFPKIEGNRVIGLVLAFLSNKETKVSYKAIDNQTEWYNDNIGKFQDAFINFQKRSKILNLSASINPMADGAGCQKENGEYVDCGIQEVIITVPKNPGTPLPPVTIIIPIIDPGTCNDFQNCAPGGGGSSLPPIDPCTRARLALSADNVKKAIEDLKKRMNDPNKKTNNEQLHIIRKDGNTVVVDGKQNHVEFSPDIYTKGSVHDHDKLGQPMFPPHDINTFINTVRVQNYPPDPIDPTDKSGEAFLGIVTPNYNYFMIFNGTKDDIPPMYGAGVVNEYQTSFRMRIEKYKIYNGPVPDNVLQQIFFEYLDKMGLSGKVSLIKQINGSNYPITKNPDGTINNNSTNPCNN
ncbi:hypothetical protein [Elizabethkingia anophelis]|uniref:Uncharacterized protein n=1 Tax=Elizabethkingia anophelis NUHP1 TaxID=1338011 RepID=A0A077EF52_9FLAO|nr:hypothetical protein [Elizabethkingia anophelis]AIL44804.1 hypothetical protein BD94_1029 [Elizabethkingia anophelis NUHP1]BBQ08302.1 hypothetical protein JUNP353_2873 [Elizabethkingia anophelis]